MRQKTTIDFATKKEMCGLLLKNIKIAPAIGGALPPKSLYQDFRMAVVHLIDIQWRASRRRW